MTPPTTPHPRRKPTKVRPPSGGRKHYTIGAKLTILDKLEAGEGSLKALAREFSVYPSQIRNWRSNKENLEGAAPKHKKFTLHRGGAIPLVTTEELLVSWIKEQRAAGKRVSYMSIVRHACSLTPSIARKKVSTLYAWVRRFVHRNGFSLQKGTKIGQALPHDYLEKKREFLRFLSRNTRRHPLGTYPLSAVGNIDQTPICFDMICDKTVDKRSAKTVWIGTSGKEKLRFTVVLAVTANGGKLPPTIIFKGERDGLLAKNRDKGKDVFPSGVIVRYHPKAWVDEAEALYWYDKTWLGYMKAQDCSPPCCGRGLLAADALAAQRTEACKSLLSEGGSCLATIPGGLTSVLQPLDVCLNKPFQNYYKELYHEWTLTPACYVNGKVISPSRNLCATWVAKAWDMVSPEMIIRSFVKCSMTDNAGIVLLPDDGFEDEEYLNENKLAALGELMTDPKPASTPTPTPTPGNTRGVSVQNFYGFGSEEGKELEDDSGDIIIYPDLSVSEALAQLVLEAARFEAYSPAADSEAENWRI